MNRRALRIVGAVALSVVVAGLLSWVAVRNQRVVDAGLTLYGTIDIREVHLGFHALEHIAEVRVEEGDQVSAGQVLALQDDALLRAQVDAAAAEVAARRAVLARLVAGSRPEQVRKARADLRAAEATLVDARATAERIERLAVRGAMDQQRADDARAAAATAGARRDAQRAALDLILAGTRQEDVDEARAYLARAEANLAIARERLDDTHLRAPRDGVVRARILEPGDLASPERPVFILALTDPVWVRAYAPEPALGKLRDGMPAEVFTDTEPGRAHPAWVGHVSPTAEFTPKSVQTEALRTSLVYQVRIMACNPHGSLRLGMPVTVHIATDREPSTDGQPVAPCAANPQP